MKITLNPMEQRVKDLYINTLNILSPDEINLYSIAEKLNIWIHETNSSSKLINRFSLPSLLLNNQITHREQWEDFGHELGHHILHVNIQGYMPNLFRLYQEDQALEFAFDFCAPTFMLLESNEVFNSPAEFIYEHFTVTKSFALRKANYLFNKINRANNEQLYNQRLQQVSTLSSNKKNSKKYSKETTRILNQLHKQIGAVSQ